MPIEEIGSSNWLTELENNIGYNHFKSFDEIYYNQSENQSLNQKIKFCSIEFECAILKSFLQSRELRRLGFEDFNGNYRHSDQSMSYPNSLGKYAIQNKYDATCNDSSNGSYFMVKLKNEIAQKLFDRKPDHTLTELVISKVRKNQAMEIMNLFYRQGELMIDYKPNTQSITSAHIHFSFSNNLALSKLASPNFYRFYLDSLDYTSIVLQLNTKHNFYKRANGFNDWCRRARNYDRQILLTTHDDPRYHQLNYCQNFRLDNGKKLNTLENRQFSAFRELENTKTAFRIYYNTVNKFLEFYQNVSLNDLMTKDLYLRMDRKAHNFKELINPNIQFSSKYDNLDKVRLNTDMDHISLKEIRDQHIRGND